MHRLNKRESVEFDDAGEDDSMYARQERRPGDVSKLRLKKDAGEVS